MERQSSASRKLTPAAAPLACAEARLSPPPRSYARSCSSYRQPFDRNVQAKKADAVRKYEAKAVEAERAGKTDLLNEPPLARGEAESVALHLLDCHVRHGQLGSSGRCDDRLRRRLILERSNLPAQLVITPFSSVRRQ